MDWISVIIKIWPYLSPFIAGFFTGYLLKGRIEKWKFKKQLVVEWARSKGEDLREMAYYVKCKFFPAEGPCEEPSLLKGKLKPISIGVPTLRDIFHEIIKIGEEMNKIIVHPSFPRELIGNLRNTITFINLTYQFRNEIKNIDKNLADIDRKYKAGGYYKEF